MRTTEVFKKAHATFNFQTSRLCIYIDNDLLFNEIVDGSDEEDERFDYWNTVVLKDKSWDIFFCSDKEGITLEAFEVLPDGCINDDNSCSIFLKPIE